MKCLLLGLIVSLVFVIAAQAQTPATVHATWTPNPASDGVTQYQIALDATAPIIALPAAVCTSTVCSQLVTVPTFGAHTMSYAACNLKLSTDPTSLQCSAPASVAFSLGSLPVVVAGAKVVN